ncbi:type I toxin-antitoxin system toxin Ldr family protein [Escherichia coli]
MTLAQFAMGFWHDLQHRSWRTMTVAIVSWWRNRK